MKPGGIYAIECSANAKVYIGSAKDLQSRQKEHIAKLSNGFTKEGEDRRLCNIQEVYLKT